MTDGIHDITADAYHNDPADSPSLSASIANVLINQSPAHAWAQHPRNPDHVRDEDAKYDIGTACHALILQGEDIVRIVYTDDWRTKDAKQLRDEARAAGHIPLLEKQWNEVAAMAEAVTRQIIDFDADPPLFAPGKPEQTIVWQEQGVTCRARIDWLHDDYAAVDDLKTTGRSANPDSWVRTMYGMGADLQARFYQRGVKAVMGVEPQFRFIAVETSAPYAISVVSLAPSAVEIADAKIDYAIRTWRRCIETNTWPSYPRRVCYAELPGWEEARWLEKEAREQEIAA